MVVIGQSTGLYVKLSLMPVMGGLALCSANELSYNLPGFTAALLTNISECCQVTGMDWISGVSYIRYTAGHQILYTSGYVARHPVSDLVPRLYIRCPDSSYSVYPYLGCESLLLLR